MGEKYYKPIVKDGDHLVRSKKNPNRVRGQSRDADNKNPDIIEWEEVEIDNDSKTREELERELENMAAHNAEITRQEQETSVLETINTGLDAVNSLLEFLNENPEVIEAVVAGGRRAKRFFAKTGIKVKGTINNLLGKAEKNDTEVSSKKAEEIPNDLSLKINTTNVALEMPCANQEKEDMSIDEARRLIIETLANYISMRKNLERLSRAKINEKDFPQLDMNHVLAYMDSVVDKYPALMDEKTSAAILNLLRNNSNVAENTKILEVLNIEY